MYRILIALYLIFFSFTSYGQKDTTPVDTSIPGAGHHLKYVGWTNDYEHIFTRQQVLILDSVISNFQKQTGIEIAIVTLDSSYITATGFDNYITSLGKQWGVGNKNKSNGIIIGISAGLRKIRISNGYGIEAKLSDDDTKRIIDKIMIPSFKEAGYYKGTRQGLSAIMEILR